MTRQNHDRHTDRGPSPYDVGDRVVIDLPALRRRVDGQHHGKCGTVIDYWTDDLGVVTGNPLNDWHFTVDLDNGGTFSARYVDLREI